MGSSMTDDHLTSKPNGFILCDILDFSFLTKLLKLGSARFLFKFLFWSPFFVHVTMPNLSARSKIFPLS